MSNIKDYIDWRGDLSFEDAPFNEVDNLIFAYTSYVELDGIVPGDIKDQITVKQASDILFSKYTVEELEAASPLLGKTCIVLKKMADSERFANVLLSGYVNEIDYETQVQFSAVTYELPDGTYYVAYRGTDDTIVGWKEDFNMSFLYQTPGQIRAMEYLNQFKGPFKKLRVGGHSKGGNFAVYASAFCEPSIQKRIIQVYSNDGPGFKADGACNEPGYKAILDRITSIVPQGSLVGMLMKSDYDHKIVLSSNTGAYQHDGISWQVLGNHFEYADNLSAMSENLDATITDWLSKIEDDERRVFVDAIFSPLESGGVYTLTELKTMSPANVSAMFKAVQGLDATQQAAIKDTVHKFMASGKMVMKEKLHSRGDSDTISNG